MSQRRELVALVDGGGVSIAELARRFGVSRKTIYKWLARQRAAGTEAGSPDLPGALIDRSRRPATSPHRTPPEVELAVLTLRDAHPAWGGRKLHHRLKALGQPAPAPSTITRILREHGRLPTSPSDGSPRRWQRFERDTPNALWQMDFKSPVELERGGSAHPLTVIDDHSRYALNVSACGDQRRATVQDRLTHVFQRYGLPCALLSDNGSPWGCPWGHAFTKLEVWLMRLEIAVKHGRPYHPQTQGKDERFHRTLQVELLQGRRFADHAALQGALDPWRQTYNHERPHEALSMATPGERYRPSVRTMPSALPALEYDARDEVRKVDASGQFRFHRRKLRAGKAFVGESVGLRPTTTDAQWKVMFGRIEIGRIDLREVPPHGFAHVRRPGSGRCAPSAEPTDAPTL